MNRVVSILVVGLLASGGLPGLARAQAPLDLERGGRFAEAADGYRAVLAGSPADVNALLGLERVLQRLGALESIRPQLAHALEAEPQSETIRELQFRIAAALDGADSVTVIAAQWMARLPRSAGPFRAWAGWLAGQGAVEEARRVIAQGRRRFGDARFAQYGAQLAVLVGDWDEAAMLWAVAVNTSPGLAASASAGLSRMPEERREVVVAALADGTGSGGAWITAHLLVAWDRPGEGWALLAATLPADESQAAVLLRRFADRAAEFGSSDGFRARGFALERLAEVTSGTVADRARLDAAQAFANAGSLAGAQRLLDRIRSTTGATSRDAATAMATFIRVLADAGQVEEAEARLAEWESRLPSRDAERIRETLAWGWIRRGDLDRAERLLGDSASVGAHGVMGWVALYRGELAAAKQHFDSAGPQVADRAEATRRSSALVLLERVKAARVPPLGDALFRVAQGDTAQGIEALRDVARRLTPGGQAAVLALAGEMASKSGDLATAETVLLAALASEPEGPMAPTATLGLAQAYASAGRNAEAIDRLEHLILTYPESAVVPQARRLLDRVRGMVPSS
jgi:tetratricopeptide (TPR) repeat protein